MSRFTAFDPRTEINGRTASSLFTNINHTEIEDILRRHGFEQIDPDKWYPIQSILDVLRDVSKGDNSSSNLVAIGMEAARLGIQALPPQVSHLSIGEFFIEYGKIYQLRHRSGDIGYVRTEIVDADHVILYTKMPYPDDLGYGIFFTYARHFCPKNKRFLLQYDENVARRDNGGEETLYHIYLKG